MHSRPRLCRRIARFIVVLPIAIALPGATRAQAGDTVSTRDLAPGVSYRSFTDARGPWVVHLLRADLTRPDIQLRHVRARDQLRGREKPSDIARRVTSDSAIVLAAMNADFFQLATGENENNQVIAGEWWKGLKVTDSPFDTWDNAHVQFALDERGRPYMDRFVLDASAMSRGGITPILTLNFNPSGNPEGTALYTPRFGPSTPRDTTRLTAEALLQFAGSRGDTALYVRRGPISTASGSAIPASGAVLAAYGAGARMREVQSMSDGDTVGILLAPLPRLGAGAAPTMIVGGWPRILTDGAVVAAHAPTVEGTISRNAEARHPRSALGFSPDSTTLFLVAVEGRSARSVGMTLVELAGLMRQLGAWQAMNLDGGGSTTMVIEGTPASVPSDPAGEREVGNVLLVVRRR